MVFPPHKKTNQQVLDAAYQIFWLGSNRGEGFRNETSTPHASGTELDVELQKLEQGGSRCFSVFDLIGAGSSGPLKREVADLTQVAVTFERKHADVFSESRLESVGFIENSLKSGGVFPVKIFLSLKPRTVFGF